MREVCRPFSRITLRFIRATLAPIVIHKSSREQNPEGVQAISRGLSKATPPDGKPNKISTPEGSQTFLDGLKKLPV